MRLITTVLALAALVACNDKKSESSGSAAPVSEPGPATPAAPAPAPTAEPTAGTTPSLGGGVVGTVAIADGGPAGATAGATISVQDHPELTATTDAAGNFKLEAVAPGTLQIYATSAGAALVDGPAAYGVQMPPVVVKNGEKSDVGTQTMKKTGAVHGTVAFLDNPNNLPLLGSEVFVPGTGWLAKTDESGAFTLAGLPEGHYRLYAMHTGFATAKLPDVTVTSEQTTELPAITLSISAGPEGTVTVAADKSATIAGAARKISTSATVTLSLTYDSDAALMKIADNPSFISTAAHPTDWEPVAATKQFTFDAVNGTPDGPKTIYVKFADLNGLESSPFKDEVIVDTTAPQLGSATLLYGWPQTAAAAIFADLVASDDGAGLVEARYLVDSSSFVDATPWVPYAARLDVDLGAVGNGSHTVYFQVRDHAGRVASTVVSDSINKNTTTVVAEATYDVPLTLKKAWNPFVLETTASNSVTTFKGDVTLEAGVDLRLSTANTNGGTFDFRGKVTMLGTSGDKILIGSPDGQTRGHFYFHNAPLGVSEKDRFEYVWFTDVEEVVLNGGQVKSSRFAKTTTGGNGQYVIKRGLDPLRFEGNTFVDWPIVKVENGDGATKFLNNTGTIEYFWQASPGTNTEFTGNDLTQRAEAVAQPILFVSNSRLVVTDSQLHGDAGTPYDCQAVVSLSGTGRIEATRLTADRCKRGALLGRSAALTLNDSSLTVSESMFQTNNFYSGSSLGATATEASSVSVTYSDLTFGTLLLYAIDGKTSLTLSHNELMCRGTASQACNFVNWEDRHVSTTLAFDHNNIECGGGKAATPYCEGGFVHTFFPGADADFYSSVSWSSNHWTSRAPASGLLFDMVEHDQSKYLSNTLAAANVKVYQLSSVNQTWDYTIYGFTGDWDSSYPSQVTTPP